jgi:hypothetical protein
VHTHLHQTHSQEHLSSRQTPKHIDATHLDNQLSYTLSNKHIIDHQPQQAQHHCKHGSVSYHQSYQECNI